MTSRWTDDARHRLWLAVWEMIGEAHWFAERYMVPRLALYAIMNHGWAVGFYEHSVLENEDADRREESL